MTVVENLPSAQTERPIGFGRLKRKEDARFIRGKGTYLDDIRLPGMLMTARALLDENPSPTEHEIRTAISGAICRCTGYKNIVAAIQWAAENERTSRQGVTT
jgi:hypothetical protein